MPKLKTVETWFIRLLEFFIFNQFPPQRSDLNRYVILNKAIILCEVYPPLNFFLHTSI